MTPHVSDALERELAAPADPPPDHTVGFAEAAVLGGAGSLLISAANMAFPVAGAAVGGAVVGVVGYAVAARKVKPALRESVRADVRADTRTDLLEAVDEVLRARHLVPRASAGTLACAEESAACRAWQGWLPWGELADGAEVPVPAALPRPAEAGFRKTRLAASRGQVADWVRSLPDGSRLHVHEYGGGALTVHRDRLDPSRDPATAAVHWLTECSEGTALGVGVLGGLAAFLAVSAVVG